MTTHTKKIARHKTAIRRTSFSRPIACLLRDGLVDSNKTLFDYGCGHGQDLELLSDMGIQCDGWDPMFRSDAKKQRADVVNMGYVINVIEHVNERTAALRAAWDLCENLLVVAAQAEVGQLVDNRLTREDLPLRVHSVVLRVNWFSIAA